MSVVDEARLDDPNTPAWCEAMLRATAGAGAQVRSAARIAAGAGLAGLAAAGRPRSIVVLAAGGCRDAGDLLAALCGAGCPVPIVVVDSYQLPGWVGVADLVVAISCAVHRDPAIAAEALRRGCLLAGVGPSRSPLADLLAGRSTPYVSADYGDCDTAIWSLLIPLVAIAEQLGLVTVTPGEYETVVATLDGASERCRPSAETSDNPAKAMARELLGTVPLILGDDRLCGAVAHRFAGRLRRVSGYLAIAAELPAARHDQLAMVTGVFGAGAGSDDFFRDRVEDPLGSPRLRLVVLRDPAAAAPAVQAIGAVTREFRSRDVPVGELACRGETALDRVASLLALTDFAAVYLALVCGARPAVGATSSPDRPMR